MKCPNCGGVLEIRAAAEYNMESYGKPIKVVTECCGTMVSCYPKFSYTVEPYVGSATEDDWGVIPTVKSAPPGKG